MKKRAMVMAEKKKIMGTGTDSGNGRLTDRMRRRFQGYRRYS